MDAWVLDENSKDVLGRHLKTIKVNAANVRDGLSELIELLPLPSPPDGSLPVWTMDEVTISLEISADSGIRLVGSASVGLTGGIEVTFRRA